MNLPLFSRACLVLALATNCVGSALLAQGSSNHQVVLASAGRTTADIVVSADASAAEKSAAGELAAYLRRIAGADFRVVFETGTSGRPRILIGRAGGRDGLAAVGPEGFCIDTVDGNLRLRGADDDGTEFAVYTFLEKYLGVRWFWPGASGEVVPANPEIVLPPLRDVQQPAFKWRNRGPGGAVWGATSGPTDMRGRELVLGVSAEHQREVRQWERRNKWGGWKIYGGHSLGEIFPPEKYATTHPEFYALVNGRRDVPGTDYNFKHGSQICTSNPAVVQTAADWVNAFFDRHPEYQAVHVTLNDSSGYCECANCLALDATATTARVALGVEPEEATLLKSSQAGRGKPPEAPRKTPRRLVITDRVFTYANQVSALVQRRHPGKFVMAMAYMQYLLPPERIRVAAHVIPQYCMWSAYKHASPKIREEHEGIAAGWARAGSEHVAMYEYYINGSWPGLHRLIVPYLAHSIRFLRQQGFDLYETQSGDDFATNGINYYIAGKLLWDPSADEKELLADFYAKAFSRAGPAVRRFQERLQAAWTAATADGTDINCTRLEDTRLLKLFTPELLRECDSDLAAAARLAENDVVRRRVEFFRDGLRFTELTAAAVREAKQVSFAKTVPAPAERKAQVHRAIAAIEAQRRFVEAHREDGVVPYFWAKYNDEARPRFLPLDRLRALALSLE